MNFKEIMVAMRNINDTLCIDEIKNNLHRMNHGCEGKYWNLAEYLKKIVTENNMTEDAVKQWAMDMEYEIDMSGCNPCGGKRIFSFQIMRSSLHTSYIIH